MSSLRISVSFGALLAATTLTDAWAAPPKADTGDSGPTFDKNAAASVLASVDLSKCRATNAPKGDGHVLVTFVATGTAKEAVVDKGPMVGTPVAKCIAKKYKESKVPAFKGDAILVGKTFHFE
jgi:hypothetical protein